MTTILLIADDEEKSLALERTLSRLQYGVLPADSSTKAMDHLAAQKPPIALILLQISDISQPFKQRFSAVKSIAPGLPLVIITDSGNTLMAMEAIANGAQDFLYYPAEAERLHVTIRNALKGSSASQDVPGGSSFSEFIGQSDILIYLLLKARAQTHSGRHLFICGERGVGKTMLARAIHASSQQVASGFRVYCLRQAAELLHIAGQTEPGYTLALDLPETEFLDAIDLPMVKTMFAEADSRNIRLMICQRTPRQGPLSGLQPSPFTEALEDSVIFMPGLRHRKEDIASQCDYFLDRNATILKRSPLKPSAQAYRLLQNHDWPGNTREVEYMMLQSYMVTDGPRLTASMLEPLLAPLGRRPFLAPSSEDMMIRPFNEKGELRRLEDVEAEFMRLAFRHYRGSRSEIARMLGIGRTTLYRKAKQLQLI